MGANLAIRNVTLGYNSSKVLLGKSKRIGMKVNLGIKILSKLKFFNPQVNPHTDPFGFAQLDFCRNLSKLKILNSRWTSVEFCQSLKF